MIWKLLSVALFLVLPLAWGLGVDHLFACWRARRRRSEPIAEETAQ